MHITKRFFFVVPLAITIFAFAEGTQTWRENSYEDFSKGTPKGVALRSDGRLEVAPSFKPVATLPSTYIWSIVSDGEGTLYVGTGAPARVYRITPDGKASVIFRPKELQVQALAINPKQKDVIYAATSPDGKVYRIERGNTPGKDSEAGDSAAKPESNPGNATSYEKRREENPSGAEPSTAASDKQIDADINRPKLNAVPVDQHYTSSAIFDPKTKYIWDLALAPNNENLLYVATGDRGEIFRVTTTVSVKQPANKEKALPEVSSEGSLFFKSDESHIRTLAFDVKGNLIAGSDGSGLIYRISPAGEAFVIYSAPKKEITALAVDEAGNIYASGIGEKRSTGAPTSSPSNLSNLGGGLGGAPLLTGPPNINPHQPGGAATQSTLGLSGFLSSPSSGGSEIYMIATDGSPKRLWSSKDDIVYALGFDSYGRLLAGSGNKGRIIALETRNTRARQNKGASLDLIKASATQVTSFAKGPNHSLYVATSNLGKIFLLGPELEKEGVFESDVFDARNFSLWGRAEIRGSGNFDIFARSGNVDNPDRNWSLWKQVDLAKDLRLDTPPARFIQWKAVMKPSSDDADLSRVESVAINYLSKNVAPVVDDVTAHVGGRSSSSSAISRASSSDSTVSVVSRAAGQNLSSPRFDNASTTQRDHGSITVRWAAHDDNDDTLTYSLYYKGDGESRWKLVKDKITEKSYSWDASLLPDGGYTVRVVASDAASHSPEEALSDFKDSARFEVDSTPPRIEALNAKLEGGQMHISFSASDTFSPIHHAEFSVDAGEWQYIAPVGELSDALIETYDFNSPVPAVKEIPAVGQNQGKKGRSRKSAGGNGAESGVSDDDFTSSPALSNEHVVVVRVYDRFDNVGIAKVVVK